MGKAIVNKQLQEIQSKLTELSANLLSVSNSLSKIYSQINFESEKKAYFITTGDTDIIDSKAIKQILFSYEPDEKGLFEVIFQFTDGQEEIQLLDFENFSKLAKQQMVKEIKTQIDGNSKI